MAGAFQANAFQNNAFQVAGGTVVIGVGIGSTVGDGFDFSRAITRLSIRNFTTGDGFDLSRIATAIAARNYSTGDSFDRVLASARLSARNLTTGDGFDLSRTSARQSARNLTTGDSFDLPRLSVSLYARNLTAGEGFGYGQAESGATLIIGTGIGFTLGDGFDRSQVSTRFAARQLTTGDGFDRSTVTARLAARPVPTFGIPVTYANATVRASINAATVAEGSSLARAAIGQTDLHLGVFLEPVADGMFSISSGSYVLSSASIYARGNVRGKVDLVPIEYRRHTVALESKSFEATNPWKSRQFTTSGSINTQTR